MLTLWAGGIQRASADYGAGQSERYFFVLDARHDPDFIRKQRREAGGILSELLNQGREVCAMRRSPGIMAAHKE